MCLTCAKLAYYVPIAYAVLCLQRLMAMPEPLVAPPVPAAAAAADQAVGQACQPLHVPGLGTLGTLQPAKLSVWKLFMEQVRPHPSINQAWTAASDLIAAPS